MRPAPLLSVLPLVLPAFLSAQSHPLVGTWSLQLPAGVRVENGMSMPIMTSGSLVFGAVGDSIIGTLKVEPPNGAPARPPARLAAKAAAGPLVFTQRSTARINMNGEESTRNVTSTFTLQATGDTLKGTVVREVEGMDDAMGGPQAVSGTRVKPAG